ncbi:MAG: 30S ribosomal protein S17 [Candidatus Diapherotrites archaeon]|nr:30S ribosomal protein S17 [Candidatus Diapherotrites archaeon]
MKEKKCNDKNCPIHGNIKVRGNIMTGVVVSDKMDKSVIVEREYIRKVPKYERYERRKSRIAVHKPECMDVKVGDVVEFGETRKISKTKSFVITKVLGGKK